MESSQFGCFFSRKNLPLNFEIFTIYGIVALFCGLFKRSELFEIQELTHLYNA